MATAGFSNGRLTINGQPRFALGAYISGGSFSTDPAQWERDFFTDAGWGLQNIPLTFVLPYTLGGMPIEPARVLLEVLQRHGVYFLATGNCFADGSWLRYGPTGFSIASEAYVRALAALPGALGCYIMDECTERLLPETEAHHQQLKSWAPNLLTFAALMAGYAGDEPQPTNPAHWTNAADVIGPDPYALYGPEPAQGYPHFIVADFTSKCRAAAKPDRPVWTVLQCFKFTDDSRLPTPDEMRAQAIMAIVEGAQGVVWWDVGVNGLRKSNTDPATVLAYMGHLRELVTELARLEPALVGDSYDWALTGNTTRFADPVAGRIAQLEHNIAVEWLYSRKRWYQAEIDALRAGDHSRSGGMLVNAANVRTRVFAMGDAGYVLAYNYTNQPQPVTFSSTHFALTSVHENKTGQTFPMTPRSFSDTLGPYEGRIYVVRGRQEDAAPGPGPIVVTPPDPIVTPPPPPPPPSPATFSVEFGYPPAGAVVSGMQTVGARTTAPWGQSKVFALALDGAPVASETTAGTTFWTQWDTRAVPNGAHTLTVTVTVGGQVARATQAVEVRN